MVDLTARISGVYPDDSVPSETDIRTSLLDDTEVTHEIETDENRVHAIASFAAEPATASVVFSLY